jgi:hypothetical protein
MNKSPYLQAFATPKTEQHETLRLKKQLVQARKLNENLQSLHNPMIGNGFPVKYMNIF